MFSKSLLGQYLIAGFWGIVIIFSIPFVSYIVLPEQKSLLIQYLPIRILLKIFPVINQLEWKNLAINWILWIVFGILAGIIFRPVVKYFRTLKRLE